MQVKVSGSFTLLVTDATSHTSVPDRTELNNNLLWQGGDERWRAGEQRSRREDWRSAGLWGWRHRSKCVLEACHVCPNHQGPCQQKYVVKNNSLVLQLWRFSSALNVPSHPQWDQWKCLHVFSASGVCHTGVVFLVQGGFLYVLQWF